MYATSPLWVPSKRLSSTGNTVTVCGWSQSSDVNVSVVLCAPAVPSASWPSVFATVTCTADWGAAARATVWSALVSTTASSTCGSPAVTATAARPASSIATVASASVSTS